MISDLPITKKLLGQMTQEDRVLWWLTTQGELDPMTALRELGIYRLSARICELRKIHDITDERRKVKNQFNESCTVAVYRMVK